MPFCVPTPDRREPIPRAALARKLKLKMKSKVANHAEGHNSFGVEGLVPLFSTALEIALKLMHASSNAPPTVEDLYAVIMAYVSLFGDAAVRAFLSEHPGWLSSAFAIVADCL